MNELAAMGSAWDDDGDDGDGDWGSPKKKGGKNKAGERR